MAAETNAALAAILADPAVATLLDILDGDGEEARIVGGAPRNALMGLAVGDIDLATTATPEEVTRRARLASFNAVPTGIGHGTVTVIVEGRPFEVTTLREDIETDGRHAVVRFGRSFETDAMRRDFTVNALSLDRRGDLHDYVGGLADVANRRVRFIGDPERRIREDYLRILRLFRFQASYGRGALDAAGFAAAVRLRVGLRDLSAERVRMELFKLLVAPGAAATVGRMADGGFWPLLIGGVAHIGRLAACVAAGWEEMADPVARLAALAVLTREDAERLRGRLRLSNAQSRGLEPIALALECLHGRRLLEAPRPADAAFARAVLDLGAPAVAAALLIEAAASGNAALGAARALRGAALALPAFPLSGADVLAHGVEPGPEIGRILAVAREAWIEAGCPLDGARLGPILDAAARAHRS